ncbi:lysosomal acid glucosylceramidase-like [Pollicipes pollicipes]|uniref:lysosomal acid glucosylceramidase-like n=1 Tax=Pollicipes pollicipes TaxID=41117 RepID=UPI0018855B6F|nr:lysosomal acid glucosylceramidase-like [Pollicipes pollicipes]
MLQTIPLPVLLTLSATTLAVTSAEYRPCEPLKFNHDSVVCACNATYCDNLPPLPAPAAGTAVVVTSSRAGARFQRVSAAAARQQVLGFGGAFTDAAGVNLAQLPAAARARLIGSYYGADGIGYSVARVPMAGCDFSTRPYTYDDVPGDTALANFSLTREDTEYKLPYLQLALNLTAGKVRVFASPWSAPAWMKSNNALNGRGHLLPEYYQTWADYFVRFLEEYEAAGVPIWGVTTQNEPVDGLVPGFSFNCMGWTAETQGSWVRDNLGPTLRASAFNATKVMILDDQREMLPAWADVVLADEETASYVDGIAIHWYGDPFFPASALTATHDRHPNKFLLNTEACEGSYPWEPQKVELGSWRRAQTYAADIIRDLNHWVTGWVDWNIALDMNGGPNWVSNFVDSPVIVDAEQQRFYKQPMFYAMGHFAAFLPPGSTVVDAASEEGHVLAMAALTPDGHMVATLLNQADQEAEISLTDPVKGHLDLTLPAASLTTVKWQHEQSGAGR